LQAAVAAVNISNDESTALLPGSLLEEIWKHNMVCHQVQSTWRSCWFHSAPYVHWQGDVDDNSQCKKLHADLSAMLPDPLSNIFKFWNRMTWQAVCICFCCWRWLRGGASSGSSSCCYCSQEMSSVLAVRCKCVQCETQQAHLRCRTRANRRMHKV